MSLRHVVKETIEDTKENLVVRAHSTNLKFKWGSVYFPLYFRHLTVGSFIFLLIAQALFSLIGHLNSRRFQDVLFMVDIFPWNGGTSRHLGYGPCSTATSGNAPVPIHNLREGRNHTFSVKRKQQQNSKGVAFTSCNVSSNLSHNFKLLWRNAASCKKTKQFLGLKKLNNREWSGYRYHHFKIKLGATLKSMHNCLILFASYNMC